MINRKPETAAAPRSNGEAWISYSLKLAGG
jgi:hypothetical protein